MVVYEVYRKIMDDEYILYAFSTKKMLVDKLMSDTISSDKLFEFKREVRHLNQFEMYEYNKRNDRKRLLTRTILTKSMKTYYKEYFRNDKKNLINALEKMVCTADSAKNMKDYLKALQHYGVMLSNHYSTHT